MSWQALHELANSLWVVWLMALFVAIVVWVYLPGRKRELEAHAAIPLEDDDEAS